jgi:hypothetical protein
VLRAVTMSLNWETRLCSNKMTKWQCSAAQHDFSTINHITKGLSAAQPSCRSKRY